MLCAEMGGRDNQVSCTAGYVLTIYLRSLPSVVLFSLKNSVNLQSDDELQMFSILWY